jgi:CO/xanthine dehydrogenase FAD-binding subunit
LIEYDFLTTRRLDKALDYLDGLERVRLLAGGTDIIVDINNESKRLPNFDYLLDISNIEELKSIKKNGEYVEIGSLVSHTNLSRNPIIMEDFPLLVEAARTIGSTQIRNRGTIGGNIVNASPAADLLPPLIALRSQLVLNSKNSERIVDLKDFLTGPYKTDLKPNEIVTKVRIPVLHGNYYGKFQKIGRRKALNISRLSLALLVRVEDNIFQDARLVSGAATPYPQSFPVVEEAINNKTTGDINIEEMAVLIAEEMVSISGERWSTPYKKPVIGTLLKRALELVLKGVKNDE